MDEFSEKNPENSCQLTDLAIENPQTPIDCIKRGCNASHSLYRPVTGAVIHLANFNNTNSNGPSVSSLFTHEVCCYSVSHYWSDS